MQGMQPTLTLQYGLGVLVKGLGFRVGGVRV